MKTIIATLKDGSTIERQVTAHLVRWVMVQGKKKTLIQKIPRGDLVKPTESFILSRFAVGATISFETPQ
jgi:hypothetical protein